MSLFESGLKISGQLCLYLVDVICSADETLTKIVTSTQLQLSQISILNDGLLLIQALT